jgi:uncharacterized RDD family membrane protein YckC
MTDLLDGLIASEAPPRGFTSGAGKRTIRRRAIWIGAALAFVQIAVPLVSMVIMLSAMFSGITHRTSIDPRKGAYWQGALWLVETEEASPFAKAKDDGTSRSRLLRWTPGRDAAPQPARLPPVDDPALVASGDRMWVVGTDLFLTLTPRKVEKKPISGALGYRSALFLYRGRPAAVAAADDGVHRLFTLDDSGAWSPDPSRDLGRGRNQDLFLDEVALVAPDERITAFTTTMLEEESVGAVYLDDVEGFTDRPYAEWKPVVAPKALPGAWTASIIGGRPHAFGATQNGLDVAVSGYRLAESGAWEEILAMPRGVISSLGAYDMGGGRYLLAVEGQGGAVSAYEVESGQVKRTTQLTANPVDEQMRRMNAVSWLSNLAALVAPLILALVLAGPMRRHRIADFTSAGRTAPFASLWRRGLSASIDLLIAFGPAAAAAYPLLFGESVNEQSPAATLTILSWLGLASLWALLWLFVLSVLEGRKGISPGKWLLGIRVVGLDLAPCGVGRALLRNLIVAIDAAFGFALAIVLIALTPNQQRLGDLATRTIVVSLARSRS